MPHTCAPSGAGHVCPGCATGFQAAQTVSLPGRGAPGFGEPVVRNRLGLDDATAERLFKRAEELVVASPLDYELRNVQSAILLRRSLARRSASLEM